MTTSPRSGRPASASCWASTTLNRAAGARLTEIEEMGRSETDEAKRHELYREMSDIMVDKCGEMTVLQVRDFTP